MNNTPWDVLAASITRLKDKVDAYPSVREATLHGVAPLSVMFDTDTQPTSVHGSLASNPVVGDRVLTLKLSHYVWILGSKGGPPIPQAASQAEVDAGTNDSKYVSPKGLAGWGKSGSHVGMRRVIPASVAVSGGAVAVDSEGTVEVTTSGVKTLSLNGIFKAGGSYKVAYLLPSSVAENVAYRMRKGSVDFANAASYVLQGIYLSGAWPGSIAGVSGYGTVGTSGLLSVNGQVLAYGELEIHISKAGAAYITGRGVSRSGSTSTQWTHTCDVASGTGTDGLTFSLVTGVFNVGSFLKVWEMV